MKLEKPAGEPYQPDYEVIKREDLEAAFREALEKALSVITSKLDHLIETWAASIPSSMWTWDYTSRWDLDMWW